MYFAKMKVHLPEEGSNKDVFSIFYRGRKQSNFSTRRLRRIISDAKLVIIYRLCECFGMIFSVIEQNLLSIVRILLNLQLKD